jgi:hypothetical protein
MRLSKNSSATRVTFEGVRSSEPGAVFSPGCRRYGVAPTGAEGAPAGPVGRSSGGVCGLGSVAQADASVAAAGSGPGPGGSAGRGNHPVAGASDAFHCFTAATYARRSAVSNSAASVAPRPGLRSARSRRAAARQPVGSLGSGDIITSTTVRVPETWPATHRPRRQVLRAQPRRLSPGTHPYKATGPRPRASSSTRSCSGVPARSGNVPQWIGTTASTPRSSTARAASRGPIV